MLVFKLARGLTVEVKQGSPYPCWIKAPIPKPLQSSLSVPTKLFGMLNLGNSWQTAGSALLLINTDYQLVLYIPQEKKPEFFLFSNFFFQ